MYVIFSNVGKEKAVQGKKLEIRKLKKLARKKVRA